MKNKKRKVIYLLTESLFLLTMVLYAVVMKVQYSVDSEYDSLILLALISFMMFTIILLGPSLNRIFCFIYLSVYSIYLIAQRIYNDAFGQYFRLSYALSIKDEWTAMGSSIAEFVKFTDFLPIVYLALILIVFTVLYFAFQRKVYSFKQQLAFKLTCLLFVYPIHFSFSKFTEKLENEEYANDAFQFYHTDYYVYLTASDTNTFVEKFGVLSLGYRDLSSSYESDKIYEDQKNTIKECLESREEHKDNELTGIFEGKNVLFVMAESFIDAAIDEQLTPTLYKMKTEGIYVKGYNNPLLSGSTSDSEFIANTSLIADSTEIGTCYAYANNEYPTTLAGIFKNAGYTVDAYHNNYGEYYNRESIFSTFGYDKFVDCTGIGLEDAALDSVFGERLSWVYPTYETEWMAYWISYSGHQPYNYDSVGVKEEYIEEIKNLYPDLDESYVSYLAKNMDLDRSLEYFMKVEEWNGKLDDLVIVFFGDHIVKGLDFSEESDFYKETGKTYDESFTYTDLLIYCPSVEGFEYEKVSTNLDLIPTMANLFGLTYDNSTILGNDIFDENHSGFYFSDYDGYRTNDFSFDANGEITEISNDYNMEEAVEMAEKYLNLREISKAILKTDYFNTTK